MSANWLLVLFSKLEKCKVFSLSCVCLESQKSSRKSGGEEMMVYYLPIIIKRRMTEGSQLNIVLRVILWLCFEQVLRDVAAGINPTETTDSSNLLYELLLGGVEFDRDNNIVLLDKEMASMRQGRAFLSQINDNVPRSLSSMEQMVDALEGQRSRPLAQLQFENLVLSMVYSAHQVSHQERKEEQEAWGGVLLKLANITVHELRGNYFFMYT